MLYSKLLLNEMYTKCCTGNAVQYNAVHEILYNTMLYKKCCTGNDVQEMTVQEIRYRKYYTENDVQRTVVQ